MTDAQKILSALQSVQIAHRTNDPSYNEGVDHAVTTMLRIAQQAAGQSSSAAVARQALNTSSSLNAIQRLRLRQASRR
jgi:hypothetical protein